MGRRQGPETCTKKSSSGIALAQHDSTKNTGLSVRQSPSRKEKTAKVVCQKFNKEITNRRFSLINLVRIQRSISPEKQKDTAIKVFVPKYTFLDQAACPEFRNSYTRLEEREELGCRCQNRGVVYVITTFGVRLYSKSPISNHIAVVVVHDI